MERERNTEIENDRERKKDRESTYGSENQVKLS